MQLVSFCHCTANRICFLCVLSMHPSDAHHMCSGLQQQPPCLYCSTLHPSYALLCCPGVQAIKEGRKRFVFLGQDIRLIPSCGIFVTMNPGYAGEAIRMVSIACCYTAGPGTCTQHLLLGRC